MIKKIWTFVIFDSKIEFEKMQIRLDIDSILDWIILFCIKFIYGLM